MTAIIMIVESVRTRASTNEALVTLAVPLEQAGLISSFMSKIGRQVGAAFADVESGSTEEIPKKETREKASQRPYGEYAKALKMSGFCVTPEVWKALGSDDSFLAWIRLQPSAHSDEFSEYVNGEGRCEAAHVSRVEYGRGVGIKPEYSAIPLTHKEHMLTHAKGESALRPREWFEEMRFKYVERWAWLELRKVFGETSMAEVNPKELFQWANFHGLEKFLPEKYREGGWNGQ